MQKELDCIILANSHFTGTWPFSEITEETLWEEKLQFEVLVNMNYLSLSIQ